MSELIWDGKYDEKGQLKPVDRTILPLQVVETINEPIPARECTKSLTRDRGYPAAPAQEVRWKRQAHAPSKKSGVAEERCQEIQ